MQVLLHDAWNAPEYDKENISSSSVRHPLTTRCLPMPTHHILLIEVASNVFQRLPGRLSITTRSPQPQLLGMSCLGLDDGDVLPWLSQHII